MIPKILHYIWVGEKEKPQEVLQFIDGWKKYCPDYEIMEWNNNNFALTDNLYAKQAYHHKKWAFVSDYLRLYALYNYGGIYLDTDVEITDCLDEFLDNDFFTGYESYDNRFLPQTALTGAKKNNKIIKDLLSEYDNLQFETKDGLDLTPNTKRIADYYKRTFFISEPFDGAKTLELKKGSMIYPYYYFCKKTEGKPNYAIHHFYGSWLDDFSRKNLIKIGPYTISKFKKRKNAQSDKFKLFGKEKLIWKYSLSKNKYLTLIKK